MTDATALIAAASDSAASLPPETVEHIRKLHREGHLGTISAIAKKVGVEFMVAVQVIYPPKN